MKTYVLDVRCYVQAENEDELKDVLKNTGISYSEYYGGYNIVDVEENDVPDLEELVAETE